MWTFWERREISYPCQEADRGSFSLYFCPYTDCRWFVRFKTKWNQLNTDWLHETKFCYSHFMYLAVTFTMRLHQVPGTWWQQASFIDTDTHLPNRVVSECLELFLYLVHVSVALCLIKHCSGPLRSLTLCIYKIRCIFT